MTVLLLAQRSDFEAALDAAGEIGETRELPGLATVLGSSVRGWTREAWDAVVIALEEAWHRGVEALDSAIASATAAVDGILVRAGDQATELQAQISARLQTYVAELIERSLRRVRSTITIGNAELQLSEVEVAQSIQLSGSLKASIQEVCSLTAQGQLLVTGRYAPRASEA